MSGSVRIRSAPEYAAHPQLLEWISGRDFAAYETPQYCFGPTTSARVSVYGFHLACIHKEVVMKVSSISPQYRWIRKVELWLRRLACGDHSANAFNACSALQKLGFPVAQPIALWSDGKGFAHTTYFLYEKLEQSSNAEQLIYDLQQVGNAQALQCIDTLLSKMFATILDIHRHAWRHGDPVPKNFLLDYPEPVAALNADDIHTMPLYLIDYDRSHKARMTVPFLKRLFDLKDLRGFVRFGLTADDILQAYCGSSTAFWRRILIFWIRRRHSY